MLKIISAIILFLPFFQGLLFLLASKTKKFKKIAKYKNDDNYTYINKLYAISYCCLGLIIGVFFNVLNICFTIFSKSIKNIIFAILVILVSKIFMDAFVNIRLQVDEYDRINSNKNENHS